MVNIGTTSQNLKLFYDLMPSATGLRLDKIQCMLQSKHVPDLKIRQGLGTRGIARIGIIMN
jgi:hypothetical protein